MDFFFKKKKVTAQVWRWPPPKASSKESGSFLKKKTKKLLHIQAEPLRKGRSQLRQEFALPAAAYLGSYKRSRKLSIIWLRSCWMGRAPVRESFLVLFVKKELLPTSCLGATHANP
jgi:hypothetical protein